MGSLRRALFVAPAPKVMVTRMNSTGGARVCKMCPSREWRRLEVADGYLQLGLTLPGGQSFRWRDAGAVHWTAPGGEYREWAGVLGHQLVVLRQRAEEAVCRPTVSSDAVSVYYRLEPAAEPAKLDAFEPTVRDFLQCDIDLREIVKGFCAADENFRRVFPYYKGARVLRQDPVECFFSFICSSNNNIKRITSMVHHLARAFGEPIAEYRGVPYFKFPSVAAIAENAREEDLREAGFGYRAKFIVGSSKKMIQVAEKKGVTPEEYLQGLRGADRLEVANELTQFLGVGRKVAGCIALMSLDQLGEIPCDTHVWQIAMRYMPSLKAKSLTPKVYESVGEFFRGKFGAEHAGIAHNTLFIAELSDFKNRVDSKMSNGVSNGTQKKARKKTSAKKKTKRKIEDVVDKSQESVSLRLRLKSGPKIEEKLEPTVLRVKKEPAFISMPKKKLRSRALPLKEN